MRRRREEIADEGRPTKYSASLLPAIVDPGVKRNLEPDQQPVKREAQTKNNSPELLFIPISREPESPLVPPLDSDKPIASYTSYKPPSGEVKNERAPLTPDQLPIAAKRDEIMALLKHNQVLVISGDTGSGKSTQIPKYILQESEQRNGRCNIICSQPRRIAATSLAQRVSSELKQELGTTVGYQISMDKSVSEETKILFCTTGILVERLVHGNSLRQFTHIILDEVHERSLEIDLSLILLKKLLPKNPTVRLILMSATFDYKLFSDYFPLKESLSKRGYFTTQALLPTYDLSSANVEISAPVKEIQGFCFSINLYYIDSIYKQLGISQMMMSDCNNALQDYRPSISRYLYDLAVRLCTNLDDQNPLGRENESILIFLPGYGEIRTLYALLKEKASTYNFWLIPLHSSIKHEEQGKIFTAKEGYRKVVISTNIAESSITVPDVRFVLDFGLFKESYFDPDTNLQTLRMEWCSKANLNQRKGRAGRVRAGYVYRLFNKSLYDELPEHSAPEILRSPLEKLILSIKVYGEPVSLLSLALDPPDLSGVVNSIENLRDAGALTVTNGELMKVLDISESDPSGEITHLGRLYARLPLHFRVSRMLFLSHIYGFLPEGLVMAACMSIQSPFETNSIRSCLEGYTKKLEYANSTSSDTLASLFLYKEWKFEKEYHNWDRRKKRRWESDHHVRGKTLDDIEQLVHQLSKRLKESGITIPTSLLIQKEDEEEEEEGEEGEGFDPDRGRSRTRGDDYGRSPSRSPSPGKYKMKKDDIFLLTVLQYGAFYPNYLQTTFMDSSAWTLACNQYDKLDYDPTRTIELTRVPEYATEGDLKQMFYECGRIENVIIEGAKGYVQFKKTRESPNLSVIKALKLGSVKKFTVGDDEYRSQQSRHRSRFQRQDDAGRLGGPYCPFQVSFLSVVSKLRTVVRRDSINSSMLDISFGYSPRFLVACFLSKSQHNTNTIAQETTLLPPKPLLAPILSLLFVPSSDVIFRTNRKRNKYLGCLVGRKLEFDFDAILTGADLADINDLRKLMNESLSKEGIKTPNTNKLRRLLLSLGTRNRTPLKMRPAPNSFLWKAPDGRQLRYCDANRSYKPNVDAFQTQEDFLPLVGDSVPDTSIFPPIQGIEPPLEAGYDYDSEEEIREAMVKKIEDFELFVCDNQGEGITRLVPEVVCQECKATIAEISKLETINNPFTGGIAWRLTNSFGFVYSTEVEDDLFTRKLKKSVMHISCRENHFVGWNVEGTKIITPESEVEIHGVNNEVILWNSSAWNNSFAMFQKDMPTTPRPSYRDRLMERRDFTCPCCLVTTPNKKEMFKHLNSRKHKAEKEEVQRKNKYARHIR